MTFSPFPGLISRLKETLSLLGPSIYVRPGLESAATVLILGFQDPSTIFSGRYEPAPSFSPLTKFLDCDVNGLPEGRFLPDGLPHPPIAFTLRTEHLLFERFECVTAPLPSPLNIG